MALADVAGARWFRYLLVNPGRPNPPANEPLRAGESILGLGVIKLPSLGQGILVQMRASRFPRDKKPRTFIQGFPLSKASISASGANVFSTFSKVITVVKLGLPRRSEGGRLRFNPEQSPAYSQIFFATAL